MNRRGFFKGLASIVGITVLQKQESSLVATIPANGTTVIQLPPPSAFQGDFVRIVNNGDNWVEIRE